MKVIDKKLLHHLDYVTIIVVLALFFIGIMSIASIMASPFSGTEQNVSDYVEKLNLDYVEKQLVNFAVGLAGLIVALVVDYQLYKSIIKFLYAGIVGLLIVLVILGKTSRGVAGWFMLESLERAIQPAELCKIVLIIAFATIISKAIAKDGKIKRFKDIAIVLSVSALPTFLVIIQPDFGTAFVFICILVCVLFVAGISWKYILGAAVLTGGGAPLIYALLEKTQQERIDVFLNPALADPLGNGYNVIQSKLSIGSGQLTGKGYFTSETLAQLKFVPERHTDFIFSGIVEAIGFIGGTVIILLYFILIFRWLYIGLKAGDAFGMCISVGVMAMLLAHVFENIGMTMGLTPVTGIPLPFISYGGSNLLTNMIAVGMVLNVYMRRPQRYSAFRRV
ncbi:MAG: rod shape-determining protein RodA [Clostridia bacterium]